MAAQKCRGRDAPFTVFILGRRVGALWKVCDGEQGNACAAAAADAAAAAITAAAGRNEHSLK